MPKVKTKKALAKRVKVTKSGKILYSKAGRRHLTGHKTAKRTRQLRKKGQVKKVNWQGLKTALPYA